jgi:hypothetical protein
VWLKKPLSFQLIDVPMDKHTKVSLQIEKFESKCTIIFSQEVQRPCKQSVLGSRSTIVFKDIALETAILRKWFLVDPVVSWREEVWIYFFGVVMLNDVKNVTKTAHVWLVLKSLIRKPV